MRHLTWLTVFAFIGLSFARLQAQPASQEQIDRARDLLRTAQHNLPANPPSTDRTNPPLANLPSATGQPAVPPGGIGTLTPDKEQQAREILQNMRSRSRPAAFSVGAQPVPTAKTEADLREAARPQTLIEAQRTAEERRNAAERNLPIERSAIEEAARQKRLAQIEAAVAQPQQDRGTNAAPAVAPATAPEAPKVAPSQAAPVTISPPASAVPPPAPVTVSQPPGPASLAPPVATPQPTTAPPVTVSQPTPAAIADSPVTVPKPASPVSPAPPVTVPTLTPELEQKARELLYQKLAESPPPPPLSGTPPAAPLEPAGAVPPATAIAPPPATAPSVPPQAPVAAQPPVVQPPGISEKEAKARELLDRKLAELHGVAPSAPPPSPPATPAATATAPSAGPVTATTPNSAASVATPPVARPPVAEATLTPEAEMQARELLQRQWNERQAASLPPPGDPRYQREAEKKAKAEAKARQEANARAKQDIERLDAEAKTKSRAEARRRSESEARGIAESRARDPRMQAGTSSIYGEVPPPAGISSSKQQRLTELLNAYLQDRISPAEYHEKRAKILAEP